MVSCSWIWWTPLLGASGLACSIKSWGPDKQGELGDQALQSWTPSLIVCLYAFPVRRPGKKCSGHFILQSGSCDLSRKEKRPCPLCQGGKRTGTFRSTRHRPIYSQPPSKTLLKATLHLHQWGRMSLFSQLWALVGKPFQLWNNAHDVVQKANQKCCTHKGWKAQCFPASLSQPF